MKRRLIFTLISAAVLIVLCNIRNIKGCAKGSLMGVRFAGQGDLEASQPVDAIRNDELKLNGNPIPYDYLTNTLYVSQNMESPDFEGKLTADEGELFFLGDPGDLKDKAEVIRSGKSFKLYLIREDGFSEFNCVFTGMPTIALYYDEYFDESGIRVGRVEITDPYHTKTGYQEAKCTFRERGASSVVFDKDSYKLTLTDKKLSLLGMRSDDDWILNSLYDDAGLIHNMLSYRIWNDISASNVHTREGGTNMEYAEVFYDNQYVGIYGVLERMDKKELNVKRSEKLYKYIDFYVPVTLSMMPECFELKYSKDMDDDMGTMFLWADMFWNHETVDYDEAAGLVNMPNAIDSNIFTMLTCATDNIYKNQYYIATKDTKGSYSFTEIPWDLNGTWGNEYSGEYRPWYAEDTDTWTLAMKKLYESNPLKISALTLDRWQELRAGVITIDRINACLDRYFSYLHDSGAYARNEAKWPARFPWDDRYIYEYADKRISFLDTYYKELYDREESKLAETESTAR